ncbi:MAG: xanthine dehydrogenase family protein molybdopterin-binding subunit, partial [Betaproteobacteria bacterium]
MTTNPPSTGVWQSVPRIEDEQLLRGQARFLDDVPVDDACHACFVRSAQAHARIVFIDTERARAVPGVVGVYVKQDLFGELTSWRMPLGFALAALPENTTPFVLVDHEVAFVGEAIAVVVASSRHVAEDAASL